MTLSFLNSFLFISLSLLLFLTHHWLFSLRISLSSEERRIFFVPPIQRIILIFDVEREVKYQIVITSHHCYLSPKREREKEEMSLTSDGKNWRKGIWNHHLMKETTGAKKCEWRYWTCVYVSILTFLSLFLPPSSSLSLSFPLSSSSLFRWYKFYPSSSYHNLIQFHVLDSSFFLGLHLYVDRKKKEEKNDGVRERDGERERERERG